MSAPAASLDLLLEIAPDAIVVVDEHEEIVGVNARAEELFKVDRDSLVGRQVDELFLLPWRRRSAGTFDRTSSLCRSRRHGSPRRSACPRAVERGERDLGARVRDHACRSLPDCCHEAHSVGRWAVEEWMDEAALRRIELFSSLSRKQRRLLAMRADEVDVPAGKVLCGEGNTAHEFFVIEEGTARVVSDGQYLDDLGAGDFFGEMGLLGDSKRTADVIAETPLKVMVLSAPVLKDLERECPPLARRLSRAIEQRREWLQPVP